jgi:uncharacterized membrane protein
MFGSFVQIPLSSVVERITSNDEVSRSSRLVGIFFFSFYGEQRQFALVGR